MAGESGAACEGADDNAASVKTAPSEADSDPPTRAEVWRVPTQNNTSQEAVLPGQFAGFFEGRAQLRGGAN
jgi:hypothetical protein